MLIETSRFGKLDVDESRLIAFTDGLLGFPDCRKFALIQTGPDAVFFWLQSVEEPTLAFVVCDPLAFAPDYTVPIREDEVRDLELSDLTDCQVLAIVNRVDGLLTANFLGPLVIGVSSLRAKQMVLSDKRYSTRQRLLPSAAAQRGLEARRVG